MVEWVDAKQEIGEHKLSQIDPQLPVRRSIGFLVYRDKVEIRIAHTDDRSWNDDDGACDTLRVPMVLIKSVTPVKEGRYAETRTKRI